MKFKMPENPLAYVKAAASIPGLADDEQLFEAFDAAECALEENAPNAADLFADFCALLDERKIEVFSIELSRAEKADQRSYEKHVSKNPGSNRGKTYGYPI